MIKIILFLFLSIIFIGFTNAVLFESPGTQYINITINNYREISDLRFNITGSEYNGSFPNNITVDIANDTIIDWKYFSYHSRNPLKTFETNHATSNNQEKTQIDIVNITESIFHDFMAIGELTNNSFKKIRDRKGYIGLTSLNNLNRQMIYISGNDTTHIFVPEISPFSEVGLYVAEGGSTYYCNSQHEDAWSDLSECNLSFAEAMNQSDEHLARKSNQSFDYKESVKGDNIVNSVNDYIQNSCENSLPCDIPVKITSETPGNISFSEFDIIPSSSPAEINITDSGEFYSVNITPDPNISLEESYYFFGEIPEVHIVPVVSGEDSQVYNSLQSELLDSLNKNLSDAWDNLTENKHPLKLNFYNKSYSLENYSIGSSYTDYIFEIERDLVENLNINFTEKPSILIIIDVHNYFSDEESYNIRRKGNNFISTIYINGFSDNDSFYNNSEFLERLFLHELMHSSVSYPGGDKFYEDHPASYSDNLNLDIYNTSNSPTGHEGYFEIYSILNQLRVFLEDSEIEKPPLLSPLDKMLLGTLNPYTSENYTFYEASVTYSDNDYSVSEINSSLTYDCSGIYASSSDNMWWDIRDNPSITEMGTTLSYNISKPERNNKSLWVYANDRVYTQNFNVYDSGTSSVSNRAYVSNYSVDFIIPTINLKFPFNNYSQIDSEVNLRCSVSDDNLKNITLYGNWSGQWKANQTNSSGINDNYEFTFNLSDGNFEWNCYACDNDGNCSWADSNKSFNIFTPSIDYNLNNFNPSQTTNFSGLTKDDFKNMTNVKFRKYNNRSEVRFFESINISRNINLTNTLLLEDNWIFLNSDYLPEFNKNARIRFFNVTLINPIIYRDGSECPDSICSNKTYDDNTYSFDVTGFSNYSIQEEFYCGDGICNSSIEENCSTCPEDCGTCDDGSDDGGGGGGSSSSSDETEEDSNTESETTTDSPQENETDSDSEEDSQPEKTNGEPIKTNETETEEETKNKKIDLIIFSLLLILIIAIIYFSSLYKKNKSNKVSNYLFV
ncbi:MAG: hypothetical protein ACOCRX_05585 [Candidatus Woesearchaeota archaeon]